MKTTTKLLLLFLIAFTFQNCNNDDDISQQDDDPALNANDLMFQNENFGNVTTGKFIGLIKNKDGEKLYNVQITVGNSIAYTDQNGFFIINDAEVFENFAYIKAYKDGFIKGSRVVIPKTNGVNRIDIVLLEKNVTATINSGETSTVSLQNGSKVTFTGDFITQDGSPYNGQVEIVSHYLRPNRTSTFTEMPGSLFAQTTTNNAVSLETYGMLSVVLLSPSGEELNIDENSPAIVEFPIDFTQTDIAPETMTLWYFDETVGYWKEQGEAIKSENKYIGEVTHFTWWNCDLTLDFVNLCFSVSSGTTEASTYYFVQIKRNTNDQLIFSGSVLSEDGEECGLIPQNEDITISIYSTSAGCNYQLVHEQVLGAYSSDSSVDITFSEEFQITTLTGIVTNCNGNPLTNGYVFIDDYNTFSVTDGLIDIAIEHCNDVTTQVQIFDFDTSQWTIGNEITLNGNQIDLGTLSTCEDLGGIYNGDISLSNQTEVNLFGEFNYATIDGSITIGQDFSENLDSDITDLTPLENLVTVNGHLQIIGNPELQTLNGLQNLETINGVFSIIINSSMTSISFLDNLNNVSNLRIQSNESLTSLDGFSNITNINGFLWILENEILESLEGLEQITTLGDLNIDLNSQLSSLNGLNNLSTVNSIQISRNSSLTTLIGLEQITELSILQIAGNEVLADLNGLENLVFITESESDFFNALNIGLLNTDIGPEGYSNPNLTDFCALENLFINGNGTSLDLAIAYNAYNPSPQDIIDGNCSL